MRSNLGNWLEHERPLVHAGVRQYDAPISERKFPPPIVDKALVAHNIEV